MVTVVVSRVQLIILTILFFFYCQRCGTFVAPHPPAPRGCPSVSRLGVGVSWTSGYMLRQASGRQASGRRAPGYAAPMVLAGLPSTRTERVTTFGEAVVASLKNKARDTMVKSAEKRGIDWTGIVEVLQVGDACDPRLVGVVLRAGYSSALSMLLLLSCAAVAELRCRCCCLSLLLCRILSVSTTQQYNTTTQQYNTRSI